MTVIWRHRSSPFQILTRLAIYDYSPISFDASKPVHSMLETAQLNNKIKLIRMFIQRQETQRVLIKVMEKVNQLAQR